ncbi:Non-specific serine/threonine protein kinase [Bertholletia excelsa]
MAINRAGTFSLCLCFSVLHLSLASAFSPADKYFINCGSNAAATVDEARRRFTGDSCELGSGFLSGAGSISVEDPNPSPDSSPMYHTARVFRRPSKYKFKINEKGTYLVRIHFHKFDSSVSLCDVQFHVSANNYVLLNNFTMENTRNPRIKDYMIWVDSEELLITFTPAKKSKIAFVNAIEVISAPKDLIADVAYSLNSEKVKLIHGLSKNAFETVYRVNVGGFKVTPFNDSLWRTWVPDEEFFKSSDVSSRVYTSGRIRYRDGGASREVAPDSVYNTARVISSSNDSVPQLNMTWGFPVTTGYKYLVRTHFCDIASISLGLLYFNVYVNEKLAYENLDLSEKTNWALSSPFYADFLVDGVSSGFLTVSVGPSNMSMAHTVDAILNGVEIMKINNSMGSLDGEVYAEYILESWPKRKAGVAVPLIAAICLLVTAYVLVHRRRVGARDSVPWSQLPVDTSEGNLKCGVQLSSGKV